MASQPPPGATGTFAMNDFGNFGLHVPDMFKHLPPSEARAKMKELDDARARIAASEQATKMQKEIEEKIMARFSTKPEFDDATFNDIVLFLSSLNNDELSINSITRTEVMCTIKGHKIKISPV